MSFSPADGASFKRQIAYWRNYFLTPARNGGLRAGAVSDPQELRELTAFFAWTAWASTAARPGLPHSYTNNFPYDPLVGNVLTGGAVIYSVLSLVFLLAGTAIVLLAFGRFAHLGWHSPPTRPPHAAVFVTTETQRAALKFMVIAALLFLAQVFAGAGLAHYRAEPGDFLRLRPVATVPAEQSAAHLASAAGDLLDRHVLWSAARCLSRACWVGNEPALQRPEARHPCAVRRGGDRRGGQPARRMGRNRSCNGWARLWFWFGNQGWEYPGDSAASGKSCSPSAWSSGSWLLCRDADAGTQGDPERRGLISILPDRGGGNSGLLPAGPVLWQRFHAFHRWSIPGASGSSICGWKGFFELFVTVIVAVVFHRAQAWWRAGRRCAPSISTLILVFGGGLIGTGHHWYFNGQSELNMALSAAFSALEVVPLTLHDAGRVGLRQA